MYEVLVKTDGLPKSMKSGQEVAVTYLRTEVIGVENLQSTTLRKIGLTSGSAALRVMVRDSASIGFQAHGGETNLKKTTSADKESPAEQVTTQVKESVSKFGKSMKNMFSKAVDSVTGESSSSSGSKNSSSGGQRLGTSADAGPGSSRLLNSKETVDQKNASNDEDHESDEGNLEINWLGERDALIFRQRDIPKLHRTPGEQKDDDLSDDFFEITRDDVLYMLQDLKRQMGEFENRPLETSRLREQKKTHVAKRYTRAIIRICFPNDGLVIQAAFSPNDTISIVMTFVRQFLMESNHDFYLYTTPPKQVLKPDTSLVESKLVPASMVHFGSSTSGTSRVLKEEMKTKITSFRAISIATADLRQQIKSAAAASEDLDPVRSVKVDLGSSELASGPSGNHEMAESQAESEPVRVVKSEGKVPKWFKTGK